MAASSAHRHSSLPRSLPVSIYGGYFGAGAGRADARRAGGRHAAATTAPPTSTKNLVLSFNSLAAAIIFAAQGVIAWPATLVMIAGTLVGALIGAKLVQVMPTQAARGIVVGVGVLLTVAFAWRYWL